MNAMLVFCFLIILAMLLFSISFGLRFYESQRRRKLVSMLRTVTTNGDEVHVNLLIDPDGKKDGVEELLKSINLAERLTNLLSESGLDWTLRRLVVNCAVCFLIAFIAGCVFFLQTAPLTRGLAAGAVCAFLPVLYVKKKRGSRIGELETQLPDALDFLSRSMRAGHAFSISLEMVCEEIHDPLGQEFRALFNELNLGASLARALMNFSRRIPLPDVHFFASAVLLQRQTGGNLSEMLNRLSQIIRERFRLKGQVKAVSAHGRMTATILTLLPIGTLAGLIVTSPGYLDPLLNDPMGRRIVALGILAQIMGNFIIRKIVRIRV
jgi:tight adherence protein B